MNGQRKRTNTQFLSRMKKKLPGTEKEMKRGDQLSRILNKEKNTTEQTNLNIEKTWNNDLNEMKGKCKIWKKI